MVFFAAWVALSYLWTIDASRTLTRATTYVQLAALAWLVWQFAASSRRQVQLLEAYLWGSHVVAWVAVANLLAGKYAVGITGVTIVARYTAFQTDVNHLGFLLALSLVVSCYLGAIRETKTLLWFYRFHLGIAAWALLLTGSRGALLAGLVAVLFIPFAFFHLSRKRMSVEIAVRVVLLLMVPWLVPPKTVKRITTVTKNDLRVGPPRKRLTIWDGSLRLYLDHPVLGVGAGNTPIAIKPYIGRRHSAHNGVLSILAETGPVGLLLFLMIIGPLIRRTVRLPKGDRSLWTFLWLVALIGFLLLSWEHSKVFWLYMALCVAWTERYALGPDTSAISS
jgi:O-antigen ligase